jgi:hypothetical protein
MACGTSELLDTCQRKAFLVTFGLSLEITPEFGLSKVWFLGLRLLSHGETQILFTKRCWALSFQLAK